MNLLTFGTNAFDQTADFIGRESGRISQFANFFGYDGKTTPVLTGPGRFDCRVKRQQVAQKTNLLALNATIEAARAGEYGRGFAVVAEEILKLADSTTLSADEISSLVEGIRAEGQQVQASMSQVVEEMESGREAVDRTNEAFSAITENAEGTRAKASSIFELADQ